MGKKDTKQRVKRRGWVFLLLWFVLIICGIVEKRLFSHPDRMMMYHVPAAVFLVLAGYHLSAEFRRRNKIAMKRLMEEYRARGIREV